MRAITLVQPWAWAIAYAGCDLLNREERPPVDLAPSDTIAIHAGKGWDRVAFEWLRTHAMVLGIPLCPPAGQHRHSAIVAVARVGGYFLEPDVKRPRTSNLWFRPPAGGCAWHLLDVARLPDPVECRTKGPGLFELPEALEGAIDVSLDRRRACRSCARARAQRYGPPSCELRDDPVLHDAGGCAGWRPKPGG